MVDTYRDWIPAGEDPGAQGNDFTDFVPAPKPTVKEESKVEEKQPEFKCEVCGKVVSSKLALIGHKNSHK